MRQDHKADHLRISSNFQGFCLYHLTNSQNMFNLQTSNAPELLTPERSYDKRILWISSLLTVKRKYHKFPLCQHFQILQNVSTGAENLNKHRLSPGFFVLRELPSLANAVMGYAKNYANVLRLICRGGSGFLKSSIGIRRLIHDTWFRSCARVQGLYGS